LLGNFRRKACERKNSLPGKLCGKMLVHGKILYWENFRETSCGGQILCYETFEKTFHMDKFFARKIKKNVSIENILFVYFQKLCSGTLEKAFLRGQILCWETFEKMVVC
jgi:hypothetical protein